LSYGPASLSANSGFVGYDRTNQPLNRP